MKAMRRAGAFDQAKKQGINLEALMALGKRLDKRAGREAIARCWRRAC